MRYLVLSDIHANLQALDAVVADARQAGFDRTLCLGDLVGYGADPDAVVRAVQALAPAAIVRGNHDKVAAGLSAGADFHDQARAAAEWTRRVIAADTLAFLRALPEGPVAAEREACPGAGLTICHGAPFDEDHYIFDSRDAARALPERGGGLCLFGHTHVPAAFRRGARGIDVLMPDPDPLLGSSVQRLPVTRDAALLVNVGAVGQPRDGDPRAAYGIVDTAADVIEFRRVDYDIKTAQQRIRAAGLPDRLASRLDRGA